ncbi:hypothetical protein I203_104013 [Kwoniella mangroviensis CBS 8507]|uniref:uncharacterized protein n=1 Tax=Kwoniella mangroviensis CBS 8507 TaxID=1296122 RepID=UPI00080D72C7|nr:uncharacterized protein I203_06316 [Kwoniella mangroviensis CBS 8507]OCF64584.1 hypothetical protein I203_06316 [Kwoniella mangroviensis CBS 8507]
MATPGEEVDQDLSHIHWSWPEAIAANPARSLANADLALDYFAFSPFWDSKSNNNVLRTQRRVENPTYGHAEEKIELNAFKSGFEYIVSHSQPPDLFVIQKREVDPSGKRDRVSGMWFILQERIYQSPTVYDVVSARLRNASQLITKTLTSLSESHPSSNPRSTTQWRSLPPEVASNMKAKSALTTAADRITEDQADQNGQTESKEEEKEEEEQQQQNTFDWHLFHSLQTTRLALSKLDELSTKPTKNADPMDELKSIEAQLSAQFGISSSSSSQQRQVRPPGSIRSNSVKGLTPNPMGLGVSPVLTVGTMGQTPNLGNLNVASPRNSLGMGMSPGGVSVPGSVIGAGGRAGSMGNVGTPANLLQ